MAEGVSIGGLPVITIGNKANSGANFDPGTNPAIGDSSGTDCTAAIQAAFNAAVLTPYSPTVPAKIQFLPGTFQLWNKGTAPVPLLIGSGRQFVEGAGMRATRLVMQVAAAERAINVNESPFRYANSSGHPQQVTVNTNGCRWSGSAPVQVNGTAMKVPNGSGSTSNQWNNFAGAMTFNVQNGGTVVLSYSAGVPKLTASLSAFMYNTDPQNEGGIRNLEINDGGHAWAILLDCSSDPNNGLQYPETTKPFIIDSVNVTASAITNYCVMMDGMEGASLINPNFVGQAGAKALSWCVPNGDLQMLAGFVKTAVLSGQIINILSTNFQDAATAGTGLTINAVSGNNLTIVFPCQLNLFGAYFNGSATGGVADVAVNNQNGVSTTTINIYAGIYQAEAGTAPAGWIVNNIARTIINIGGNPTFRKVNSNPIPLTATQPLGVFIQGGIQFMGAQTAAGLLANTIYAGNAESAGSGFSALSTVAGAYDKSETGADPNLLTFSPPETAGKYRLNFIHNVEIATGAVMGWTAKWTDNNGYAQAPTNLDISEAGSAATAKTITTSAGSGHQDYYGSIIISTDASGAKIVIKTTSSGILTASKASAWIEKIA